jgi:hypothetical protein
MQGSPLFTSFREGIFSETGLPNSSILGNSKCRSPGHYQKGRVATGPPRVPLSFGLTENPHRAPGLDPTGLGLGLALLSFGLGVDITSLGLYLSKTWAHSKHHRLPSNLQDAQGQGRDRTGRLAGDNGDVLSVCEMDTLLV